MSTNGILDFQNTNKVIFRGTDSNVVVDTSNASIGIGIQGTEKPGSNLHVIGDASISSNLKLTTDTSIIVNSNVVTDFNGPHGREPKEVPLKKYPERVKNSISKNQSPIGANTFVYRNFTLSSSTTYAFVNHNLSNAIDDDKFTTWSSHNDYNTSGIPASIDFPNGHYIQLELPNKIRLKNTMIQSNHDSGYYNSPKNVKIYGSNDGLSWTLIKTATNLPLNGPSLQTTIDVDSTNYYKYHRLEINNIYYVGGTYGRIAQWELYGYEEDPPAGDISVDTTFKSILNTPQTTRANVYVDAKLSSDFTNHVTGPTPVGPTVTHDNTNKYWEMNGQLTSNITVEANTFLEGDQPHAVSVWFNSSNLEANVSNTCVFSVSDQEKLDSVNLDLQSNTWHNLTYAYQGEGGSRVTYLDGRKVAEDQAEDTFGAYPPFAMTGYSQGGYVVSASTEYTTFSAWNGFDEIQSANGIQNHWSGSLQKYNTNDGNWSGDTASVYTTNVEGVNKYGEWLQIEFPHKIKYSYSKIKAPYDRVERQPRDGYIVGSNDLSGQWTTLHRFTGVTRSSGTETVTYTPPSAPTNAFKYIRIVIEAITASVGQYAGVDEWDIYGHRENDLVRLPDPTNVLKYPHIAMSGYAQRGYVASASSVYDGTIYPSWQVFDNDTTTGGNQWISYNGSYNVDGTYAGSSSNVTQESSNTWVGEWLQIELPNKIQITDVQVLRENNDTYGTSRSPNSGAVLGSNNGSSWVYIHDFSNKPHTDYTSTTFSSLGNINTSGYYRYLRLVITKVQDQSITGNTNGRLVSICELRYYGTEEATPVPIQIGGGNIDKVANFRVYDKFIDENQALEIWDAQKDVFREVKNSMTLHKGRHGIGTTEPEGRLAVADEPDPTTYGLQEFPPKPLVGYKTHIEGHGEFCVTESAGGFGNAAYAAWRAFDKDILSTSEGTGNWISEYEPISYDSNGVATGNNGVLNGVNGEYLILESPYKIKLSHVLIYPRPHTSTTASYSLPPKDGKIWGRNTLDEPWTEITSYANLTYGATRADNLYGQKPTRVNINATQYYKYIAFQITATNISYGGTVTYRDYANLKELRYFGYREQVTKQSVLHDGQLTLTKNLTVPRIGPALDADDTPRRDRLVVEYNTSTNPTFEGVVRDTSGRGNDGVFYGDASYDATEKALVFPGSDDFIFTQVQNKLGAWKHSVSFWVKYDNTSKGAVFMMTKTGNTTGQPNGSIGFSLATGAFRYFFWDDDVDWNYSVQSGTLYHIALTYDGGTVNTSRKLYINGVDQGSPDSRTSGQSGALDLETTTSQMKIGCGINNGEDLDGQISNFKLYDTALTADEVKTLYDMGRCDEGHHTVNFSKTRVGIGLGDGEAPRAALDVRGVAIFSGPLEVNTNHEGNWLARFVNTGRVEDDDARVVIECSDAGGESQLIFITTDETTKNLWHISANAGNAGNLSFQYSDTNASNPYNGGTQAGFITRKLDNASLNFTGQHRTFIKDVPFSEASNLEGLIVSSNQNKYIKMSNGIEAGSNAITTNESLPIVSLSNVVMDKKCFGVISASEDPEERSDAFGNFVSVAEKEKGDTRVYINSVGEGAIWVVNTNGSLESGDYITTSNVAGYGQKQDDDILHNYTVAKITMDCDFEPATRPIQIIKKDEEGENVLDEHDQIQWEDHPTDTEKAYKIRYLDAQSAQTDEANAVHIAAFVGCTYHCG